MEPKQYEGKEMGHFALQKLKKVCMYLCMCIYIYIYILKKYIAFYNGSGLCH